jgi:hypothetical protein
MQTSIAHSDSSVGRCNFQTPLTSRSFLPSILGAFQTQTIAPASQRAAITPYRPVQERAQRVQRALLQTEKVAAERLFILAPPVDDAASKGQSRVNLSLN